METFSTPVNGAAPQMKSWVVFNLRPADVLTLAIIHGDAQSQMSAAPLPADTRVSGSVFRPQFNLLSLILESDEFQPVPSTFHDNRWDGAWPHAYLSLETAPAGTQTAQTPAQVRPVDENAKLNSGDYPPAPDFIKELHAIYQASQKLEFRVRGLVVEAADIVALLRADATFQWRAPFLYPADTRVLGVAELAENQWILWCSHPSFEICPVIVENEEVLLEIVGDGQPHQFRVNLPGVTIEPS